VREHLAAGLIALCGATQASSVHVTFAHKDEWTFLAKQGFLQRTDQQFHWHNEGYGTFEDFLATLASRHRKAIRRERRDALADGITIHALTGDDITPDAWDAFFEFYMETGSRKWGRPYLTRSFYDEIGATMAKDVLLVMAKRDGTMDRRRDQFHRLRDAVRPPLGRDRASSLPAFRSLLLSGHRLRDPARAEAR
jgi:predicted N-acyltransferase